MHDLATILVVDDEPDMCWALANILRLAGYVVTTVTTGGEALTLVAGREPPYAVAFVDAKLPDADGLELAVQIHQQSPQTGIILISGYYYQEDGAIIKGLQEHLLVGFVSKPFQLDQVRLLARQAADRAMAGDEADDLHSVG